MTQRERDQYTPAVFIPAHPVETAGPPEQAGGPATPPAQAETPGLMQRTGRELFAWAKTLVSAAVYALVIVTFGFQVARVDGQSMTPTLEDQERLVVNKAAYLFHDPQVGDVVMHYFPDDPSKTFVKRIVAREGETIRSDKGRVFRDDVLLDDSFIPEENRSHDTWGPYVVPKGYYFVMGDHRNNSLDSRDWKFVPKRYILGKIQLRWWPIGRAHIF